MKFWELSADASGNAPAVIDENGIPFSYAALSARVEDAAAYLKSLGSRRLGFLFISNTIASLVAYLACLRVGHVPLLLPAGMAPELVTGLRERYLPDWSMGAHLEGAGVPSSGLRIVIHPVVGAPPLAENLGLLLSTSGSTGSPKLVRLSYANLQANAASIAAYLNIRPQDRALTVLPPYYSYGLSVINSHLQAGACLVLRDVSVLAPAFAQSIREHQVTSLSGVPFTYQMLWRSGFPKQDFPSLHTLTQAGGRLADKLLISFGELARERNWRFFVMYGQTEATARISYVPPQYMLEKIGAIGIAIPGGQLSLAPENSELIYHGPNVMLGYAAGRDDLRLGDEQHGLLRTGDIAHQDADGYFYITGRLKRFVKLAGHRIGLDELEQHLQHRLALPVMAAGQDERLVVWIESGDETLLDAARQWLASQFGIHHSLCRFRLVESLPVLPSGKKNYQALLAD